MDHNRKLIVMLSTYNGEPFLDEQLESVFLQKTAACVEVYARDDGSTDKSKDILHKWAENYPLEIIKDCSSLGAAKSFWQLLQTAGDADYYAFADQDDRWDADKIQTAIEEIGICEDPVLWFSGYRLMDDCGKLLPDQIGDTVPVITMEAELICGFASGCTMVFNRAALRKIRSYPIRKIPMHDVVMIEYMLAVGRVLYHHEPMISYRLHRNNTIAKSGKPFIKRMH